MRVEVLAIENEGDVTVRIDPSNDVVSGRWIYRDSPQIGHRYDVEFDCDDLQWGVSAELARDAPRAANEILATVVSDQELSAEAGTFLNVGGGIWLVTLHGLPSNALGENIVVSPTALEIYAYG